MRTITWALATQRGVPYNPTYLFNELQLYLNFIAEYKALKFVRISDYNSARIKFINMPVAVMQTDISKFTCKISSYFNFSKNRFWCCKATCHEFLHMAGGAKHIPQPHVMSVDAGKLNNFSQADCTYLNPYAWKNARRPWLEPNKMSETFKQTQNVETLIDQSINFQCTCEEVSSFEEIDIDDTPMFVDSPLDLDVELYTSIGVYP